MCIVPYQIKQLSFVNRFGHMCIHAGSACSADIIGEDIGCHGYNRYCFCLRMRRGTPTVLKNFYKSFIQIYFAVYKLI